LPYLVLELRDTHLARAQRRLVSAEGLEEELLVGSRIGECSFALASEGIDLTLPKRE
jgi:hypothetical protein